MKKEEKDIIVFYHANCPDGFGAAWAAWRKLGDTAEYHPYHHGASELPGVSGKTVYTLDFTPPEPIFSAVLKDATSLICLDHHKTAEPHIARATEHVFDNAHSGSVLSWQHFHPGEPVPKLLLYIEDNDLWLHKLPFAQEIPSLTWIHNYDFAEWSAYAVELENPETFARATERGSLLLKAFLKQAGELAEEHYFIEFENRRVPVANCPGHVSEVGHHLYTKYPPMSLLWSRKKECVIISLRSNGDVDVAELATHYGGGGHKQSAGFTINLETINLPENQSKKELLAKLFSPSQK